MKQCPSCNRVYADKTFLFCLEDGTKLVAGYDPEATVVSSAPEEASPIKEINKSDIEARRANSGLVEFCPSCGSQTSQTLLCFYAEPDRFVPLHYGYLAFRCEVCEGFILYSTTIHDYTLNPEEAIREGKRMGDFTRGWPRLGIWVRHANIPEAVSQRYILALKAVRTPDLFASRIIRVLETVCDDKGIPSAGLRIRLSKLVSMSNLPSAFSVWMDRMTNLDVIASKYEEVDGRVDWQVQFPFRYLVDDVDNFMKIALPLLYPVKYDETSFFQNTPELNL